MNNHCIACSFYPKQDESEFLHLSTFFKFSHFNVIIHRQLLMSDISKLCNDKHTTIRIRGRRGRDRMVVRFKTVPITTKIVSSNPAQVRCTRYNMM